MCDCCDYIAARGGRPGDPALTKQYELLERFRTRAAVAAGRWRLMTVEPAASPRFSYTVGLWSLAQPELAIFGLREHESTMLLNVLGEHVVRGRRINDGDDLDLGKGWQLKAFRITDPRRVIVLANDFYRGRESVPALQLVYPDVHGTWPWEPDCHLDTGTQPLP